MKAPPNHAFLRVQQALEQNTRLTDVYEVALADVLQDPESNTEAVVARALEIYQDSYKREVMEAALLGDCTPAELRQALQIDEKVTEAYLHLFFDTGVFEDGLDKIAYANNGQGTKYGRDLKLSAVETGKESLLIRLSRGNYTVPAEVALRQLRSTAFMLSQAARLNPTNARLLGEAHRWAQLCLRASATPDEHKTDAVEDFLIGLSATDDTKNAENSELDPKDILH